MAVYEEHGSVNLCISSFFNSNIYISLIYLYITNHINTKKKKEYEYLFNTVYITVINNKFIRILIQLTFSMQRLACLAAIAFLNS